MKKVKAPVLWTIQCEEVDESEWKPDESDFLAEGKKAIPVEVLSAAYIKFLDRKIPPPVSVTGKGGRN